MFRGMRGLQGTVCGSSWTYRLQLRSGPLGTDLRGTSGQVSFLGTVAPGLPLWELLAEVSASLI